MTNPSTPQDQGRAVWPWIIGLIVLLIIIFWIWHAHDRNVAVTPMTTDSAMAPVTPAVPATGTGTGMGTYGTDTTMRQSSTP